MKAISVFFDGRCGLCRSVRGWLEREPQFVALHFVSYDARLAREIFPRIADWQPDREILALTDEGDLYQGAGAWILCLWATVRFRPWALRLARPALRPSAEKLCRVIARNRRGLSRVFRRGSDDDLRTAILAEASATPMGEACRAAGETR